MLKKTLQNNFALYLISIITCFILLISVLGLFFNMYLKLQDTEIKSIIFLSSWDHLNEQSNNLYYSNKNFNTLEKEWYKSWDDIEITINNINIIIKEQMITDDNLLKSYLNILTTWTVVQDHLNTISLDIENIKSSPISQNLISSEGYALNRVYLAYLNGKYTDEDYYSISRLQKSINLLNTTSEIFDEIINNSINALEVFKENRISKFKIVIILMLLIILPLTALFLRNIFRLNFIMSAKIKEQTSELELRYKELIKTQKDLENAKTQISILHLIKGIAHEINTPLSISLNSYDLINSYFEKLPDTSSKQNLNDLFTLLHNNLYKIDSLVQTLKGFVNDTNDNNKISINLLELVSLGINEIFKYPPANCIIDIQKDTIVKSNPINFLTSIKPVIQNWMDHNSLEEDNFKITYIETKSLWFIKLESSGKSLSKEELKFCMEPFYTTVRKNGHLGLGLSLSYATVKNRLGGDMYCFTPPNGNGFVVLLKFIKV